MKRLIKKANIDRSQFTEEQLEQIDLGDEYGLDVSVYADPNLSAFQMETIRDALEYGIHFYPLINPNISESLMEKAKDEMEDYTADINSYLETINEALKSDEEVKNLIEKVKRIKAMRKNMFNYHDEHNRTFAIVYFNGNFYEGRSHAACLNQALEEEGRNKLSTNYIRPTHDEIQESISKDDVMFFANLVIDPNETKVNNNTGEKNAIYIIPHNYLAQNITIEKAVDAIKSSEKYSDYGVFLEASPSIDYKNEKVMYPRLAKLKNINKMLKFLCG